MNIRSVISAVLSLALIFTTSMPAYAGMIGTGEALAQEARSAHVAQVQAFVERDEVRGQLEAMGVDPAHATERVAAMTDSELQQLATNIEELPAGGVLGVVVVVLVILLLLEILGVTNIFSKV